MTFEDTRIDIRNLQVLAFTFLMLWGLTGNGIFLAGFPLVFVILGYSIASIARDARSNEASIQPFRQTLQFVWTWFSHVHLVILATVLWIFIQPTNLKDTWVSSGFLMSTGLGNWSQITRPENYFGFDSQTSPFIHLWVVNALVQVAVLLMFIAFLLRFISLSESIITRIGVISLFLLSGYLLYSFHNNVVLTSEYFLSTWSWLWAILFGCALGFLHKRLPESKVNTYIADVLFFLLFTLLVAGYFNISVVSSYYIYIPLGLVLILVLASLNETLSFKLLSSSIFSSMSHVSFGAFLWHWPLAQFVKRLVGVESLNAPLILGVLLMSFGLSFISTLILERLSAFIQNIGGLRQFTSRTALLAVVPLALFFIQTPASGEVTPNPTPTTKFIPALEQVETDIPDYINDPNCTLGSKKCLFGDKKSNTHLVLIGNDLSGNWQPALAQIAEENGWKLEVRIHPECPVVEPNKKCDTWREQTVKYLLQIKPDMVLTNFNIPNDTTNQSGPQGQAAESLSSDILIFERLIKNKIKVVMLRGASQAPSNPVECLRNSNDYLNDCLFSRSSAYLSSQDLERRLVFMPTGVEIIDATGSFCSRDACFIATPKAEVIYRTSTLITKTFALKLAPSLSIEIEDVLTSPISTRPYNCRINDRRAVCATTSPNPSATGN